MIGSGNGLLPNRCQAIIWINDDKDVGWHKVSSGGWINIKTSSYQHRKSHCGDKTILRPSYLHNGISYTGKTASLYWIMPQSTIWRNNSFEDKSCHQTPNWADKANIQHPTLVNICSGDGLASSKQQAFTRTNDWPNSLTTCITWLQCLNK